MVETKLLNNVKTKILSNIINAKFPDIYEICVTYRIFKKEND